MIAHVYIDGIDIKEVYGLTIASSSYANMITWAPLKKVEVVDWHEIDGVDPDLSSPVLDTRKCNIRFVGRTASPTSAEAFVALLSDGAYHTFETGINRNYTLRLTRGQRAKWIDGLCIIELTFADDFPMKDYTYHEPSSTILPYDASYIIDQMPLTAYGARLLEGWQDELTKTHDVKNNLIRSFAANKGIEYDANVVVFAPRNVNLNLLMRANSLKELWNNYDALLFNLVQPEARQLKVRSLKRIYPFYYVSSNVRRFFPDDKIWLEFTITINVYAPAI